MPSIPFRTLATLGIPAFRDMGELTHFFGNAHLFVGNLVCVVSAAAPREGVLAPLKYSLTRSQILRLLCMRGQRTLSTVRSVQLTE